MGFGNYGGNVGYDGNRWIAKESTIQVLSITDINPSTVWYNDLITVTGTKFMTGATVMLGGTEGVDIVVINSTTIQFRVPIVEISSYNVTITNPDEESVTSTQTVDVVMPTATPLITGVNPTNGPIGTFITITGENFFNEANVSLNGIYSMDTNVVDINTITCTIPFITAGTYDVTVTNPDQQTAVYSSYIVEALPRPMIASVNDQTTGQNDHGVVSDSLLITGSNFDPNAQVYFDLQPSFERTAADNVFIQDVNTIYCNVPNVQSGYYMVLVYNPDNSFSRRGFTVD